MKSEKSTGDLKLPNSTMCLTMHGKRQLLIKSVNTYIRFSNCFNSFYHEVKILSEEDNERKLSYLALILLTKAVLSDWYRYIGDQGAGEDVGRAV